MLGLGLWGFDARPWRIDSLEGKRVPALRGGLFEVDVRAGGFLSFAGAGHGGCRAGGVFVVGVVGKEVGFIL